jgi:hypothetical protein
MYYGLGQTTAPAASDSVTAIIKDILAVPALQPIEASVVNAAQPYVPTAVQGFLSGWWATNKNAVLLAAAGFGALYLFLRKR